MSQLLSYHFFSRFCISWKSRTIQFVSNIKNIHISLQHIFWGMSICKYSVKSLIVTPEMKKMIIHRQLFYQAHLSLDLDSKSKVCTISFERPVNYLCDAWHVFPPSMKRGLISIIKLMQFTIVRFFKASLGEALFQKACH